VSDKVEKVEVNFLFYTFNNKPFHQTSKLKRMAKRKKSTHKKKTYRRRRVSGINSNIDTMGLALAVGGAVAARILNNKLSASTNATAQKAAPYAGLILGIVLPMLVKNPMVKGLSVGLAAGGGVTALGPTGLKMISGFDSSIAGIGYPTYAGYNNQLPYRKVAGIEQGTQKGTRSNFSGSRMSQMNTIAGIAGVDSGCGGANPMN
jgi:hypothetical protein